MLIEAQGAEARLRHLLANGHTTRANYDVALKNLRSAEAKLDSAKAALALAKDQLELHALHADFDGIVTAVGAEAGQVVNVGQMVCAWRGPTRRTPSSPSPSRPSASTRDAPPPRSSSRC